MGNRKQLTKRDTIVIGAIIAVMVVSVGIWKLLQSDTAAFSGLVCVSGIMAVDSVYGLITGISGQPQTRRRMFLTIGSVMVFLILLVLFLRLCFGI